MIAALSLVAALLLAPAQTQAESKPATAAEIAAAKARADAIIAAGDAGEFFENITSTAAPMIRHKASGLTCSFGDDPRESIHIYTTGSGGVPRARTSVAACG